jgi:hypothetical protein
MLLMDLVHTLLQREGVLVLEMLQKLLAEELIL